MTFVNGLDAITSVDDADLLHIRTFTNLDKKMTVENFETRKIRNIQPIESATTLEYDTSAITSDTVYSVTPTANITFTLTTTIPEGFEVTIINTSATYTVTIDNYVLQNTGTKVTAVKCVGAGSTIVYAPMNQETIQNNITFEDNVAIAGTLTGTTAGLTDLTTSGFISVNSDLKTDSIISKTAATNLTINSSDDLYLRATEDIFLYPDTEKRVVKKIPLATITNSPDVGDATIASAYIMSSAVTSFVTDLTTWSGGSYYSMVIDKTKVIGLSDETDVLDVKFSYTSASSTQSFGVFDGQIYWGTGADNFEIRSFIALGSITGLYLTALLTYKTSSS